MTAQAQPSPIFVCGGDQASKLEAIAQSGACKAGGVVALDFRAVQAAVGDRWALRRTDLYEFIERGIQRHVSRSTISMRITETEYLLSFTDVEGPAAQVLAFNIMEDLLTHLLGRCDPEDLIVKCVSDVTSDTVEMRPLSRADVERQKRAHEAEQQRAACAPAPACTLIEGPAERLRLQLSTQDILHIASGLTIGTRMSIGLHQAESERLLSAREEAALSTGSLMQVTSLVIARLREIMEGSRRPAVFVLPVFLQTMTSTRGRAAILEELRTFRAFDQRRLITEITGIDRGTPSSRLMETSWQLRPFCRAVTGRAQLERSALDALTGARLSGVHVSARDLGASPAQRAAGLLAAGQATRGMASMVMAVDLPDADALKICAVAGFTHATLPAGAKSEQAEDRPSAPAYAAAETP